MASPDDPAHAPAPLRDTIYYDGACNLCTRSAAILRKLDWLHRLDFRDMSEARDAAELPVAWEQALAGMPMRTRDGRTLVGFPAIRRALHQTPAGAPLALLLSIPGVSALGARVYNAIARSRRREHTCAIDTASPRNDNA